MPTILTAPAKLTLSVHITGIRGDGFHELESEMVTIDLCDELTITEGDGLQVVPAHGGLPVAVGGDNSVAKALRLAGKHAQVRLVKQIPAGAGLGGGSADAAAILRWAEFSDLNAAASLGADVPFCVSGGRARVTGIGEKLEALPFEPAIYTLAIPPFGCSTPAVYKAWDDLGGPQSVSGNDLEPAALHVEPRLAQWRDQLGSDTGQQPRLAGSGSTWFVHGDFPGAGRVVTHAVSPGGRL